MKHTKIANLALAALVLLVSLPAMAQTAVTPAATPAATTATAASTAPAADIGSPNAASIGVDTAQQKLKEVSIDKFEAAGFWIPTMSTDEGLITGRLFIGSPAGKANEVLADERVLNIDNKVADSQVYGIRVDFFRRGFNSFEVRAKKPIPIEGISKTLSVWIAGRNYKHELKIILSDFFGREYMLPLGTLNFQGWKKLSVAVPPQAADGTSGIVQRNFHYNTHMGLKVLGFRIECDPIESYGVYYMYFDDLRAVTDLFAEDNRDPDDMPDSW
ncbi:MAG: flagellar filament outer layer protein FlaA [Spirochaetota bacterium]